MLHLEKRKFAHHTVNHSTNFVDPITGAHTQGVEHAWGQLKRFFNLCGELDDHF